MEERKVNVTLRILLFVTILTVVGGVAFAAGLSWAGTGSATVAHADERAGEPSGELSKDRAPAAQKAAAKGDAAKAAPRTVYPKETELDFEGMKLQGEIRNPGEFYFQHRPEEKFDSLVKRRKNFHKEMLRDAVSGK